MKKESKRVTISYPAIEHMLKAFGLLTEDLTSQLLAGYIEKALFQLSASGIPQTVDITPADVIQKTESKPQASPNLSKLAAMASNKNKR